MYPAVDPIPLPAPVWLMKLLSMVTLGLHFSAVMILIGSLLLITWFNFKGRSSKDTNHLSAAYTLAKRLPVLMTFVINLGVPPLLFLQVLYGRQVYSSSVLIGVMWISVIFLVMLNYWLLYRTLHAIENKKAAWPISLAALLVAMGIGQIYTFNMTLMLRPEVWQAMYAHSPMGLQAATGDPTMTPRWLFVMAGGPLFGGLWAALLSNMVYLSNGVRTLLRKTGGMMAFLGAVVQVAMAYLVMTKQPDFVTQGIASNGLYMISGYLCAATMLLAGLIGLIQGIGSKTNVIISTAGVVVAFLAAATAGVVRDGIRDYTLLKKGFDVFDVKVHPNWSVLIAFLLLFVIMLGVIFWLLMVMRKATPPSDEVTA